jgi:hypothetical protein
MIVERTAAYLLAVACVFQMLRPSGSVKPHYWRSIDVQIGSLRMQATNDADSVRFEELADKQKSCASDTRMPLLDSWQKEPKGLLICINDSGCITAWSDGTSPACLMEIYGSGKSASGDCPIAACSE